MTESRIAATERLRREGRWEEASLYRDELRRMLKADGRSRSEANDASREAMLAKYPPLPVPTAAVEPGGGDDQEEDADFDSLLERSRNSAPNLPRDTLWVYENLENKRVKPGDAPSLGAWSLLQWAREYRHRFFEQLLPKAMAIKPERYDDGEVVDDPGIENLRKMLRH